MSKVLKIVLDAILSVVVLFVTAIVFDGVAGLFHGTSHTSANGEKTLSSGVSIVLLIVSFAVAIGFAGWFYGFLNKRGKSTGANENVGE